MSHWYTHTGASMHEVTASGTGKLRPTTMRDARKLNLVPSVMTILSIIDKPGLTKWQVDQGIMAALTLGRRRGETDVDFLQRLYQDSRRQALDAATIGEKIHNACEHHISGEMIDEEFLPHAIAVRDEVEKHFPHITDWITEKSFAHPLGFGGRVDLSSPSTGIVIDFKGKEFEPGDGKRLAYEQHYQLGGYQLGLEFPITHGMNIFFSRSYPGHAVSYTWSSDEMRFGREVFLATFNLWKTLKKFNPAFAYFPELLD